MNLHQVAKCHCLLSGHLLLRKKRNAGAILDRFLHHAEIIRLEGRSYRMHDRKKLRKTANVTLTEDGK